MTKCLIASAMSVWYSIHSGQPSLDIKLFNFSLHSYEFIDILCRCSCNIPKLKEIVLFVFSLIFIYIFIEVLNSLERLFIDNGRHIVLHYLQILETLENIQSPLKSES